MSVSGTNLTILSNYTIAKSIEFEINSTGLFNNKTAKTFRVIGSRILGYNSITVLQDLCEYLDTTQDAMNTPTVGQTLYLVSTSANDSSVGTGIRTVDVIYLDASGNEQEFGDVVLNGTTPVSLGSGVTAIQVMYAKTAGSGVVAAGNISVTSTNGAATVATTFDRITAGLGRSLSGRYKIPNGYTGYIKGWGGDKIGNTQDMRLRVDVDPYSRVLSTGVYTLQDRLTLDSNQTESRDIDYIRIPQLSTIKVSTFPGANGAANKSSCHFELILIAN